MEPCPQTSDKNDCHPLYSCHGYHFLCFWLNGHFDHTKKKQNRCYQARFIGSKLSKLRPALCPGPRWRSFQRSPNPLNVRATGRGNGKEGERRRDREDGEKGREEREGLPPPSLQKYAR